MWLWVGLGVLGLCCGWQAYRMCQLRRQVQRIVSVLSAAGPGLNRRIVEGEQGTSVKIRDVWQDYEAEEFECR